MLAPLIQMIIRDFYYVENGDTKRVSAERHFRDEIPAEQGQCLTLYDLYVDVRIRIEWVNSQSIVDEFDHTMRWTSAPGPIENFVIPSDIKVSRSRAGLIDTPVLLYGYSEQYGTPWGCSGKMRTPQGFRTLVKTQIIAVLGYTATLRDNQPDDCGTPGSCTISFYTGDSLIHQLNSCPEISETPPNEECNRCCTSLLPLLRNIRL